MQEINQQEDLQIEGSLEIGGVAHEETQRIKEYEKIYELTHPKPRKTEVPSFWKSMGFEAVAFYLAAIGGVVLASIRTGGLFMATEEMIIQSLGVTTNLFYKMLPIATMVASLFAFELYLFAIGLRKGREKGALNTSPWGTGAAFIVSILAGAISSLPLVGVSTTVGIGLFFSWFLVIGMAAGASILAYLGAENIGVLHNVFDKRLIDSDLNYDQDRVSWYSKMQTDYRSKGRSRIFGMDSFAKKESDPVKEKEVTKNIQASVREFLKERGLSAYDVGVESKGHVISPKAISDELGYTSTVDMANVRTALNRLRDEERR